MCARIAIIITFHVTAPAHIFLHTQPRRARSTRFKIFRCLWSRRKLLSSTRLYISKATLVVVKVFERGSKKKICCVENLAASQKNVASVLAQSDWSKITQDATNFFLHAGAFLACFCVQEGLYFAALFWQRQEGKVVASFCLSEIHHQQSMQIFCK